MTKRRGPGRGSGPARRRSPAQRRRPQRQPANPFDLMVKDFGAFDDDSDPAQIELEAAELFAGAEESLDDEEEETGVAEAVLHVFIPEMLLRPGPGALTLLLAIAQLFEGPLARAARIAATGMVAEGVTRPAWAGEQEREVSLTGCVRLRDTGGLISIIGGDIHRGERGHSVLLVLNHVGGDNLERVAVLPEAGVLAEVLPEMAAEAPTEMVEEAVSPAEFLRVVREALDGPIPIDDDEDEEAGMPSGAACAMVLAAWLRRLA